VQRFVRAVVIGVVLAISFEAAAAPQRPKLDRSLWYAADHPQAADPVDVIITTEASGFAALRARLQQHGDRIVDEQPQWSMLTVVLHAADLQVLEADFSIRHLSANAIVDALSVYGIANGSNPPGARCSTRSARRQDRVRQRSRRGGIDSGHPAGHGFAGHDFATSRARTAGRAAYDLRPRHHAAG
jgi:hypothetical protein